MKLLSWFILSLVQKMGLTIITSFSMEKNDREDVSTLNLDQEIDETMSFLLNLSKFTALILLDFNMKLSSRSAMGPFFKSCLSWTFGEVLPSLLTWCCLLLIILGNQRTNTLVSKSLSYLDSSHDHCLPQSYFGVLAVASTLISLALLCMKWQDL